MQVKVITGQSTFYAAKNLLSQIDINQDAKHFVIVPDRFSLQIENMIMDELDITSTFNIEVLGISRLATRILKKLGINGRVVSADENLLITQQAIDNVMGQFKSFKKNSIGFSQEVSKVISQFKSSGLAPDDIKPKTNKQSIKNKYHDLAIIYEEYERLLGSRLDANKLLVLFSNEVMQSPLLKDTYLYLAGFDSFTREMFDCISALAKSSKGLFIALPKATTRKNEHIFENDILTKLIKLCDEENITVEVEEKVAQANKNQSAIFDNLFSASAVSGQSGDYFLPLACQNMTQEVLSVGQIINSYIHSSGRYRDISIACSNLEKYMPTLQREFARLDIPYFADQSTTADKLILSQNIFKLLKVVAGGFSKEALLDFFAAISNKGDSTDTILQTITKFNVHGMAKSLKYLRAYAPEYFAIFDRLLCARTNAEFCACTEEYIRLIEEKYKEQIEQIDNLSQKNMNAQNIDLVFDALESIRQNRASVQTSANEFLSTLKLLLSFNEVSSVPTYVDSVMIGDASRSYFVESKLLFVLGGQELPVTIKDDGLVSDDDISSVHFIREIEPSIKMLNRRNRFKLFNLLTLAQDRLFLTFLSSNDDGKRIEIPNYLNCLCDIFNSKPVRANYLFAADDDHDQAFVQGLASRQNAMLILAGDSQCTPRQRASLQKLFDVDRNRLTLERDRLKTDAKKLFFDKGYTKVTQIETYFSCPFKHFVRYGLKLKDDDAPDMAKFEIGNICHSAAELFVKKYKDNLGKLDDQTIEKFLNDNLDNIVSSLNLKEKIENLDEGKILYEHIKAQCAFILKRICYEQKHSRFRPRYLEKQLEDATLEIEGGGKINLRGKVDRIDTYDQYFRILDYKTGKIHPLIKDLYYGDKLQLFVYQSAIAKMLGLSAGGVYYFDCQYDFGSGEDDVILKGLTKDDGQLMSASDTRLGVNDKSDLIAVELKKGKQDEFKGTGICKTSLSNLQEYAERVASKALGEICQGYIEPKPDENACSSCAYRGICLYSQKGYRKKSRTYERDIESALKGEPNGQV